MYLAPHHRRRTPSVRKRTILPAAIASLLPALHSPAATVSWAVDSNGTWTTPSNWSTNTLPGPDDDVIIDRPNAANTVTIPPTGTRSIRSLVLNENLTLSSTNSSTNVLAVATTAKISGLLTLDLGTLSGGTWTTIGSGEIYASGKLDGVTLAGNLTVPHSSIVGVANGLTLASATIKIRPNSVLSFSGTQTLSGTGAILLDQGGSNSINTAGNGTLTIAPDITIAIATSSYIATGSASITLGSNSLNRGTISSPISGKGITVTGTNWTNAGTLSASNGGTLTLGGSWTNTGTLSVGSSSDMNLTGSWSNLGAINVDTGGKLTLGGTFTPAAIGALTNNGTVSISGTLDNTGNTFTLPAGNTFSLAGGTIAGGTVNTTSAGATANGTLSGVTLGGKLTSNALTVNNGLTLAGGTLTLATNTFGNGPSLTFNGTQTLGGTGTILFSGGGPIYSNSGTLTIGSGVTIATSNGSTLQLNGSWSNLGTINVGSGGKLRLGGTFTPASIGTVINNGIVSILGTLTNTDNTLMLADGTGNTFSLAGGTIVGGTVNTTNAGATATGTLSAVALGGNLTVPNGGTLAATSGLMLAGGTITLSPTSSTSTLNFSGSSAQALGGTGTVLLGGSGTSTGSITSSGALTIAPGITIATSSRSGSVSLGSSSVNQGTISSQISGQSITVSGTSLSNTGLFEARNGGTLTVSQTPSNFASGKLTGGTWAAYAGSTLRVSGAAITTNAATILLDGAGSNFYSSTSGTTNALSGLVANQGSFTITNGRNFTTAGDLTNSGTLTLGPSAALKVKGALTNTGTLSLASTTSALLIDYTGASSIDALRNDLLTGHLTTPLPNTAVAYFEVSQFNLTTYAGLPIDATTLLAKLTLPGDANLDGKLNADDYALLDRSFAKSLPNAHWTDGDFNYDGTITPADYLLIDTTYLQQGGTPSPSFLSQRESQFGSAYAAALVASVPEPSLVGCGVVAIAVAASRRRRR